MRYPSNSQGITTAPRLQNHTLQRSSALLSSAPFSDKALACPPKLQQSTRLSLARIKRGPSLSLPTSPPPLRGVPDLCRYVRTYICALAFCSQGPVSPSRAEPGIQPACLITDLSLFHFQRVQVPLFLRYILNWAIDVYRLGYRTGLSTSVTSA